MRCQRRFQIWFTRFHGKLYRVLGTKAPWSKSLLLLTTTGRKSGKKRSLPLLYVQDGDNLALIGSNAGADKPPTWWLNLQANPNAVARIGKEDRKVVAEQASDEETARLWPEFREDLQALRGLPQKDRPRLPDRLPEAGVTSDALAANPDVLAALRRVAEAARIEVSDEELEAVASTVVALLARPLNAAPPDLTETELAFGLQLRKG